jgi:Arc/MetJ-type ribon-helix-helix transcriptional regulator
MREEDPKEILRDSGAAQTGTDQDEWPTGEQKQKSMAQAKALRQQAAEGGLRFEVYLPPTLATWLLDKIERGVFRDPSEAVFVFLGEAEELEPHTDLRKEFLRRRLDVAINDPRPAIPAEQVFDELRVTSRKGVFSTLRLCNW